MHPKLYDILYNRNMSYSHNMVENTFDSLYSKNMIENTFDSLYEININYLKILYEKEIIKKINEIEQNNNKFSNWIFEHQILSAIFSDNKPKNYYGIKKQLKFILYDVIYTKFNITKEEDKEMSTTHHIIYINNLEIYIDYEAWKEYNESGRMYFALKKQY